MELSNPAVSPATTAKPLWSVKEHPEAVEALAFSQDRKMLASCSRDGSGCLWDVTGSKPKLLTTFKKRSERFASLAFSPNRQLLAAGCASGQVSLFSVSSKAAQEIRILRGNRGSINTLSFSSDGKLLAGGGEDQILRVWEPGVASGSEARILLPGHTRPIVDVAFAPNGQSIATAGLDGSARVWAMGPVRPNLKMSVQLRSEANAAAYSPDGRSLATASLDGQLCLWEITGGKPTVWSELPDHPGGARLLLITPDGETLVSVGKTGGEVIGWHLRARKSQNRWDLPVAEASSFALTPDGRYLARGRVEGTVELFRVAEKRA